ncbi:MAG: flavodoxin family protein, partial [candidate division WOR-3 bacterium]
IGEVCDNSRKRDDPRADDDFVKILKIFLDADIIVWSTPVYWQGVSAQMKCFIDRLSSYFNRPPFSERFDGKGHIVLCTFGRPDDKHGTFITEPMKLTVEVLRGIYLGDICVSSCYQKGKIKEKKSVLLNAFELGKNVINEYTKIKNKNAGIS